MLVHAKADEWLHRAPGPLFIIMTIGIGPHQNHSGEDVFPLRWVSHQGLLESANGVFFQSPRSVRAYDQCPVFFMRTCGPVLDHESTEHGDAAVTVRSARFTSTIVDIRVASQYFRTIIVYLSYSVGSNCLVDVMCRLYSQTAFG